MHLATFVSLASFASFVIPAAAAGQLNLYWGQNGDRTLAEVCQQDGLDYVTLSVVNQAPEQDGTTNYPGMEFAAHCPGTMYTVDGVASNLIEGCTDIQEGIPVCQAAGTKVLLSIGGVFDAVNANYNVTTEANGRYFADFMWGAFGPYNASWTGPRPFDLSATVHNAVDGFDFDIEAVFTSEDPWIAMIDQLRGYWTGTSSSYLITGAPQCPIVSDPTLPMKQMIAHAQFDILWIQFYNNPECDATGSNFNFDQWIGWLPGTRSAHAQLFIGLPADQGASGYLDYATLSSVLTTYGTRPSFGGVMLWDEYLSYTNTNATSTTESYANVVKQILAGVPAATTTSTTSTPSATPSACSNPYTVQPTDDCYDLAVTYDTTVMQIMSMNPSLDSYCDLTPGEQICLPQRCTQYYTVESGNTCYIIDTKFGITFDQLQAWNPGAVNADCTNLNIGQVLCVSVSQPDSSSSASSTSTVNKSTTSSSVTSTATSSSLPCTQYYTVEAGNTCYIIDTKFGITFDQLLAWNPGTINADCTNLGIGQVLCVSVSQPSSSVSSSSAVTTSTITSTATTIAISTTTVFSSSIASANRSSISHIYSNTTTSRTVGSSSTGTASITTTDTATSTTDSTSTPPATTMITSTKSTKTASTKNESKRTAASPETPPFVPCGRNYLVEDGDTCESIMAKYDKTLIELQEANPGVPELDNDCAGLRAGQVICVRTIPIPSIRRATSTDAASGSLPLAATSSCPSSYTFKDAKVV
ncbi:Chitinase 2 [Sporothrix eucalyptigena]|uniref:Chitinase 2 n=1 Tax=Sporothrix eucalyptigena TaxID=1812306 RepID=A0ABP0C9P9_9PEZI